jgi:hypothetical protein
MKTFILSILLSLTLLTPDAKAVALGPFAVTDSFCQDFQKIGGLLNAFQIVQWPVAGAPGIATGLTQRTSVIHDLCDFITQLEQLDGVNAIFFSANYLNELTGKKWDHHLKLADKTWNLANSVYDFDNGGVRQGALTSESTARDLNDWMESAYSWHGKTFNNQEVYIKHRQEREADMQNFSRATYQSAILKEATNCPTPPDDTNYAQLYKDNVQKFEVQRDDAKDDSEVYKQQLYYMGPYFVNNDGELKNYIAGLQTLERDGVAYKVSDPKTANKDTYKPGKSKDAEDHVIPEKQKLATKYYSYKAVPNEKIFNDFKSKWSDQWSSYVTAKWTSSGSFGALTGDAKTSVENDFLVLSDQCNESRLSRGLKREDPDFEGQLKKLVDTCKNSQTTSEKQAKNLFDYYVVNYQRALTSLKEANSEIWSFESQYAGINHLIGTQSRKDGDGASFQAEDVACSEKMEPAELMLLQTKQANVALSLSQITAEAALKQSTTSDTNQIEENKSREENRRRQMMTDERAKAMKKMTDNPQAPFKVKGL